MIINISTGAYRIVIDKYVINNNTAIILEDVNNPTEYIRLSANTDQKLPPNQFVMKDYAENKLIAAEVKLQNIFKPTGTKIKSGFVELSIYEIPQYLLPTEPTDY